MPPNIFDYATSELSQDAFLAWLFRWAEDSNKENDGPLHECAKGALKLFFKDIDITSEINSVQVISQYEHIDLWVTINDRYHIIIEDKTNTSMHDNQLARYKAAAKKWYESIGGTEFETNFSLVYYKTGYVSEEEKSEVKKQQYNVVTKQEILPILKKCESHSIINDYIKHLKAQFTDEENLYKKPFEEIIKNPDEWGRIFQNSIRNNLDSPRRWGKKYMGWYWCWSEELNGEYFFQLDYFELSLVFKGKENVQEAIEKVKSALSENPEFNECFERKESNKEIFKIKTEKWLQKKENGYIDKKSSLDEIHKIENFLWKKILKNS